MKSNAATEIETSTGCAAGAWRRVVGMREVERSNPGAGRLLFELNQERIHVGLPANHMDVFARPQRQQLRLERGIPEPA